MEVILLGPSRSYMAVMVLAAGELLMMLRGHWNSHRLICPMHSGSLRQGKHGYTDSHPTTG